MKTSLLEALNKLLKPLDPENPALSTTEKSKEYNHNLFILIAIIIGLICQICFFLYISSYPLLLFICLLAFHLLMVVCLFKDPIKRRYIMPLCILYFLGVPPLLAHIAESTIGLAPTLTVMIPYISLYIFRSSKVSAIFMVMETLKVLYLYRPHLQYLIRTKTTEELLHLFSQESIAVAIIIPMSWICFRLAIQDYSLTEESIKKISQELESSRKALNQKRMFILSLSHEIRNPLNSILGNIELAFEEAKQTCIKQKLFNARVCGELLLSLINNVLDVSKADVGNIEICPTECDLLPLIEKIWITFREMIKNKGLTPKLEIATRLPKILRIDQHRVTQILFNLISNAIKFTEKGEVRVRVMWKPTSDMPFSFVGVEESLTFVPEEGEDRPSIKSTEKQSPLLSSNSSANALRFEDQVIEKEPAQADSIALKEKGELILEVIDTGAGISPENQNTVFNKFVQVSSDNKKTMLGAGLGLWITKKICDRMGGSIEVRSQVGQGTTFSVKVPAIPCQRKLVPRPSISIQKHIFHSKLKAMIVEDSPFNAEIISNYLKSCNSEILHLAPNGLDAVQFYEKCLKEKTPLHLITMDLEMPVMNGRDACKEIRKLERQYNVFHPCTIVIISGNSVEAEISRCLDPQGAINADHFIRKPAKRHDLEVIARNLMKFEMSTTEFPTKILVVDDDNFNLKLLDEMLGKTGTKPFLAQNGKEALELYQKHFHEIKLIFMDCEMKIMDGFVATEKIRAFAKEQNIKLPVIYGLTGHTEKEIEERCRSIGMQDIIKKPVSYKELLKLIYHS